MMEMKFKRSAQDSNIYDRIDGAEGLEYFRLSEPTDPKKTRRGVIYELDSWRDQEKFFHTGLILIEHGLYFGDYKRSDGKRYLLGVLLSEDLKTIQITVYSEWISSINLRIKHIKDDYRKRATEINSMTLRYSNDVPQR